MILENVAIADQEGLLPFYHLAHVENHERERLPGWYQGIGSFSRELVASHAENVPHTEDRIVETEVPCLTFESLCRKHAVERIDLLLIDTEGHDWNVIQGVDLERRKPRLIVYEHYHLALDEREAALSHLERAGYETMEEHFDTFCLRTGDVEGGLATTFRGLKSVLPSVVTDDVDPAE